MNTAEERLQKRRNRRLAENSQKDYDYGIRVFLGGLGLLFFTSVLMFWSFVFFTIEFMRKIFGSPEELDVIGDVLVAMLIGFIGFLFGQIVALIFIRRIAKKYQGNIFFGTHPVRNMVLACFFFYNIIFYLLLGLFAIFKGF